jgi:hypothetical protein
MDEWKESECGADHLRSRSLAGTSGLKEEWAIAVPCFGFLGFIRRVTTVMGGTPTAGGSAKASRRRAKADDALTLASACGCSLLNIRGDEGGKLAWELNRVETRSRGTDLTARDRVRPVLSGFHVCKNVCDVG